MKNVIEYSNMPEEAFLTLEALLIEDVLPKIYQMGLEKEPKDKG